ncbi:MAG TPA: glycosyltransferase family 39 protein [Leptolyngbyaceae cyanobacterium]
MKSFNTLFSKLTHSKAQLWTRPGLIYLGIALWQGILLICSNAKTSFMAHDEGWYATLAYRMVRAGDWLTPRWGTALMYDKTSGVHWLIATAYTLFGVSETTARIPSFVASIASVLLIYAISTELTNRTAALLGALSLSTVILWTQYGQLATQDMPMVAVELFCIWALLRAENQPTHCKHWGFLAGACLGLGFFVKGFMAFLPAVALLPYLVLNHRRHRHLTNLGLYLGLATGIGLVLLWFYGLWTTHGAEPFRQLFGILALAASKDYHGVGPWYYLWNIPANFLPWSPLAIAGLIFILRDSTLSRKWLTLGYPAVLLLLLQIFPTKTIYYPLQLYPFLGMYTGVALFQTTQQWPKLLHAKASFPRGISFVYGLVGLIAALLGAGLLLHQTLDLKIWNDPLGDELYQYALLALLLGLGWVITAGVWLSNRQNPSIKKLSAWLASLLISPWLTVGAAGLAGLIGDYSPDVKAFCRQSEVEAVLQKNPVSFVVTGTVPGEDHKTWILTTFCTPTLGQHYTSTAELKPTEYAWLSPQAQVSLPSNYRTIGQIRGWLLVQAPD